MEVRSVAVGSDGNKVLVPAVEGSCAIECLELGNALDKLASEVENLGSSPKAITCAISFPDEIAPDTDVPLTLAASSILSPAITRISLFSEQLFRVGDIMSQMDFTPTDGVVHDFLRVSEEFVGQTISMYAIAYDELGNCSLPARKSFTVAWPGTIAKPTITMPTNGAEVSSTSSVKATTSAFTVSGGEDTHASTDWKLASDNAMASIINEELGSKDLVSHTFSGLSLDDGKTYYLQARHNGVQASSEWSTISTFNTDLGQTTSNGDVGV